MGAMRRSKKHKLPPFVAIYREMLSSEAWRNLTNAARVAYVHLKSKCVSYDQDEVTLSYGEVERGGIMDRHTFSRAIKQLEASGFISKEQSGGLWRKRNHYRLVEKWRTFGK